MKWENFVILKTEKFIRVLFDKCSSNDLFLIMSDSKFKLILAVYEVNQIEYRRKLPPISNEAEFNNWISNMEFDYFTNEIDSGEINIQEIKYLDCYF